MDLSKKIKVCCVASADITLKFMLLNQLKFLRDQGYDVSAACGNGKWVGDVEREGIKVKIIPFKRKVFSPISDIASFFKLYFYFKKEKFDIVHTHTPKPEIYGQIAAKLAGVPIIIDALHGFYLPGNTPSVVSKMFLSLERFVAKFSDCIFSVSNAVIDAAVKEKICQPRLLKYLGRDIDTNRFNPGRFSEEFVANKKKQLGIKSSGKILGIVGRMVEEKGYLELFEAFKTVLTNFPDAILLVVGQHEPMKKDKVYPGIVKKYGIQNNVIFLGERGDVEEIYSVLDLFVLPTHREGIGASILEASAMELPVIATTTGGCPEAVSDGKTGILVPVKEVERLSKAIIYLLSNPKAAKEMGVAGRKKILKEFNEKLIFDILGAEYKRLIKEKLS